MLAEGVVEQLLPKNLEKGQVDGKYELVKRRFLSPDALSPFFDKNMSIVDAKRSFGELICTWLFQTVDLTESQQKLNEELLSILEGLDSYDFECYTEKLKEFLQSNKGHPDLKIVLNFPRGNMGLTVLHAVATGYGDVASLLLKAGADPNAQDSTGKTPLHYIAKVGYLDDKANLFLQEGANPNIRDHKGKTPLHYTTNSSDSYCTINLLLRNNADCDIQDNEGKTPLQIAVDNNNHKVIGCFLTENQKKLREELEGILFGIISTNGDGVDQAIKNLKKFLDKHNNNQELKIIFNIQDKEGKSEVLSYARAIHKEAVDLLLQAGATEQKKTLPTPNRIDSFLLGCDFDSCNLRKDYLFKSTLWNKRSQKAELSKFLVMVSEVQDMYQLEEVVDKAIEFGVRINFSDRSRISDGSIYSGKNIYNFADYIMKKISELKKNPEIASSIVCKLVSRGATFYDKNSIDIMNTLEFKDHKTNMVKAYEDYVNRTLEFMEVVESAVTGKVEDAKMDNSIIYLEYSEESKIDVAKITDGARNLGITHGEMGYGRNMIKIGKSEVEIITKNGIRNYTDLTDDSDIVLIFYTSLGELEVRLYPDKQNKSRVNVEVSNQDLLEWLKNHNEEIGKNCLLGGHSVYKAIEQGYFERPGRLISSETMSLSEEVSEKVKAAVEDLKPDDIVNSSLDNTSLSLPIQKSIERAYTQGA